MKMQNADCMRSMMSCYVSRQRLALDQAVSTDNVVPSVHALRQHAQHGHTKPLSQPSEKQAFVHLTHMITTSPQYLITNTTLPDQQF